jgi:30S ribosomal protein S31
MGRGDIKTKKGKISSGSYGVLRPHNKKAAAVVAEKPKKAAPKKEAAKKPAAKKTPAKKAE